MILSTNLTQLLKIEHEHETVFTESKKWSQLRLLRLFRIHAQFAGLELQYSFFMLSGQMVIHLTEKWDVKVQLRCFFTSETSAKHATRL